MNWKPEIEQDVNNFVNRIKRIKDDRDFDSNVCTRKVLFEKYKPEPEWEFIGNMLLPGLADYQVNYFSTNLTINIDLYDL